MSEKLPGEGRFPLSDDVDNSWTPDENPVVLMISYAALCLLAAIVFFFLLGLAIRMAGWAL